MRYEDIINLTKLDNGWCFVIPTKWLWENKCKDYDYKVQVTIDLERIQIYPLRSEWEKRHPSIKGGTLMEIPEGNEVLKEI